MALVVQACADCPFLPKIVITGKYCGVEVKHEAIERGKQGYELGHPLKKCPVLKVNEGAVFESNAIVRYIARTHPSKLYGANDFEAAEIDGWLDIAATEIDCPVSTWFRTIVGAIPNDPEALKKAIANVRKVLVSLDAHLLTRTFLVRDRLTIADIVVATSLLPAYRVLLDPGFRKAFKNTNRWFQTCVHQPHFASVLGAVALCDKKPVAPAPAESSEQPKKEPAPKKEQAQKPKKTEEEDDDHPEVNEPPKKKPFADLPPSKFNMVEFKVTYSNEDYRSVTLPYFYEHFDPTGWSLWLAEYKYPKELEKLFMVSNLLGGFYQRAEHIRDHLFGSFLIFGEENNYEIFGAILLRGTEWPADVMSEIPDVDSYNFRKVDLSNEEDKEWLQDLWGWDGKLKGKKFTDAGKVFK
jgi:elongation factor 1-gamma